jgi:hypothetical protein
MAYSRQHITEEVSMTFCPSFFRRQAFWATLLVLLLGILPAVTLRTIRESGFSMPLMIIFVTMSWVLLGVPGRLRAFALEADAEVRAWLLGPLFSKWYVAGFYALTGVLMFGHFALVVAPVHGIAVPLDSFDFCAISATVLGAAGIWMDSAIARIKRSITPDLNRTR